MYSGLMSPDGTPETKQHQTVKPISRSPRKSLHPIERVQSSPSSKHRWAADRCGPTLRWNLGRYPPEVVVQIRARQSTMAFNNRCTPLRIPNRASHRPYQRRPHQPKPAGPHRLEFKALSFATTMVMLCLVSKRKCQDVRISQESCAPYGSVC